MTDSTAISVLNEYTDEQKKLLYTMVAKDLNDTEMLFFLNFSKARGLNPLLKEIYGIIRIDKHGRRNLAMQTSIDGFRSLAESTGEYEGQTAPEWTDGSKDPLGKIVWVEAWTDTKPPAASRVGVYRKGFRGPVYGVARFAAFCTGEYMWTKMGDNQIAKCAEAQAFRKAFPRHFGQVYVNEEMEQADTKQPLPAETKAKVTELADRARKAWSERSPATTAQQELPRLMPGDVTIGGSTKWKDHRIADAPMEVVAWLAEKSVNPSVQKAAQEYMQLQQEAENKRLEAEENAQVPVTEGEYEPPGDLELAAGSPYDPLTGEVT
jgi:phage recombination protein Bet